jgi:excisionase family DNA binding protein
MSWVFNLPCRKMPMDTSQHLQLSALFTHVHAIPRSALGSAARIEASGDSRVRVVNGTSLFWLHGSVPACRLPCGYASFSPEDFRDEEDTYAMAARKQRQHVNKGHRRRKRRVLGADQIPQRRQLLKPEEAAAYLSVSAHTIRQWIWQKRLPVVRIGRTVRLRLEDLEALIKRNREEEAQP